MTFSIQPVLENERIILQPLASSDFDVLFNAASDQKIWEQHPQKDRWKKEVFQSFFESAIQSGGAFKIIDKDTGDVIGSTRFFDYDAVENRIEIGYTFYATRFWGTGINPSVKKLMMDYIFQYVDKVCFLVDSENYRSQIAVGRLGAAKVREERAANGEPPRLNFVYEIKRSFNRPQAQSPSFKK